MGFFSYNSIRLGLTSAKALQTVIRFSRKTRRRYATPESIRLPNYPVNIDFKSMRFCDIHEKDSFGSGTK
jgi:hypothetical protein